MTAVKAMIVHSQGVGSLRNILGFRCFDSEEIKIIILSIFICTECLNNVL